MMKWRQSGSHPERGPFAWLLITQLVFIGASPLLSYSSLGHWVRLLGFAAIVLAGIYAAAFRRGLLVIAIFLSLPAVFAWLGPDFFTGSVDEVSRLLTAAACYAFTAVVVIGAVAQHHHVTRETIVGGIDAYLLIGLVFMLLHTAVAVADPSAYRLYGGPMVDDSSAGSVFDVTGTMIYFSFTTLTTLGYGDIVPQSSPARLLTSAEAVIGQLYVAIFIARLVSIQVTQRTLSRGPEAPS